MRADKAGGVEIYCAKNYLETRRHWGVGGVILHEYSHAYHYKHCENGFDNDDIQQVWYYTLYLRFSSHGDCSCHSRLLATSHLTIFPSFKGV
jgi:hypothetical protein